MATSDPQAGLKFEKFPVIFPVTRQFERRPVRGRLRPQPTSTVSQTPARRYREKRAIPGQFGRRASSPRSRSEGTADRLARNTVVRNIPKFRRGSAETSSTLDCATALAVQCLAAEKSNEPAAGEQPGTPSAASSDPAARASWPLDQCSKHGGAERRLSPRGPPRRAVSFCWYRSLPI